MLPAPPPPPPPPHTHTLDGRKQAQVLRAGEIVPEHIELGAHAHELLCALCPARHSFPADQRLAARER
jgi:hypothetical protein